MDLKDRLKNDNISVSIRRKRYKRDLRRLYETTGGRDMTDRIFKAIEFYNRYRGNADRVDSRGTYREDRSMTKGTLRDFIKKHFDLPEDSDLESKSKAYLEGYLSIRLQDLGADIGLNEMEEIDLSYIIGLLEGSEGKVDTGRLVKDSNTKTPRDDIRQLREERLNIGESRDDKSVEKLREERQKLYDGLDERVERMVKDKVEQGKDEVEALRESRYELFSEGG